MATKTPKARQWLVPAAVVAGAGLGSAGLASAATSSSGSTTTPAASSQAPATSNQGSSSQSTNNQAPTNQTPPAGQDPANRPDPASLPNGPGETVLSGDDLSKAVAAAQANQSGATVIRAETDSSGKGTYEVHMKKADGTDVTVYLDSSFNVTGSDSGFGGGPKGDHGPQAPATTPSQGSTSTN